MNSFEFTALIFAGSLFAGFLGALTGLGGGVVVVPLLALVFHVDIHYAIGAALVSVIATSSGAAAAYVREGYSNVRVGMFLEMATTMGALAGAALVLYLRTSVIAVIFGVVLIYSALVSFHQGSPKQDQGADRIATWLHMDSTYPTINGFEGYHVRGVPMGFLLMVVA
ncbi:MAG: sulfite exporter TauE/SafE family protein, partial [Candidatus Acidiferrum sp.]